MKKIIVAVSVLVVSLVTFSVVSPALAAGSQKGGPKNGVPQVDQEQSSARRGGGQQLDGVRLDREIQLDGQLEELIDENLAQSLGISPETFSSRLEGGESAVDIAVSLGVDLDAFHDLLDQARVEALSEGVDLGFLTQEQADWLLSRGQRDSRMGLSDGDCLME